MALHWLRESAQRGRISLARMPNNDRQVSAEPTLPVHDSASKLLQLRQRRDPIGLAIELVGGVLEEDGR